MVISRRGDVQLFEEIVINCDYHAHPSVSARMLSLTSSTERHLILLAMELSSHLYLKDV